jgi:hypothetical protein
MTARNRSYAGYVRLKRRFIARSTVPRLPYSIELHDSRVSTVAIEDEIKTIRLRPAYIHREGKGWSQDADIIVHDQLLKAPIGNYGNYRRWHVAN